MNPFNLETLQWLIGKDIESIPYEVLFYLSELLDLEDRDSITRVLHAYQVYSTC